MQVLAMPQKFGSIGYTDHGCSVESKEGPWTSLPKGEPVGPPVLAHYPAIFYCFLYLSICLRNSGFSLFVLLQLHSSLCCFFFLSLPTAYLSNPFIYLSSVYLPGISFNIYLCLFFSALSLLPLCITINLTIKSLPLSLLSLNKIWF